MRTRPPSGTGGAGSLVGVTDAQPGRPETPVIRAKKSAKVQFTSTILLLEAFVVVFATFVLYGLRDVPAGLPDSVPNLEPGVIWTIGASMFVTLVVLSRACGRPGGYVAGSVAQILVAAWTLVIPLMGVVALVFIGLWVASLRLGGRVDRERAEYDAAHPDEAPNV